MFLILVLFLLSLSSVAADSLSYSGRLVNSNGSPAVGPVKLKFDLFYSNDTTEILCSDEKNGVDLVNGVFHVKLDFNCGATSSLEKVLAETPVANTIVIRVTDITSSSHKIYPYQTLHSIPYAIVANFAKQLTLKGTKVGQVLTWSGASWTAAEPVVPSTGTVSSISVGDGLYGGTITEAGVIGIQDGGVTAAKLSNMGATEGQILKWTVAGGWAPASESGVGTESDPLVLPFARTGLGGITPEICESNQVLHFFTPDKSLRCYNIVDNGIDPVKDKLAPSQKAVHEALADKQDKILSSSEVMMKSLRLTNDGTTWVDVKVPSIAGNYAFTLPAGAGASGQYLKNTGSGVLIWDTPSVDSANIAAGSINDTHISSISTSKITGLEDTVRNTTLGVLVPDSGLILSTDSIKGSIQKIIGNVTDLQNVQGDYLLNAGGELTGDLSLGGNSLTNVKDPVGQQDAATRNYVDLKASKWTKSVDDIYYTEGNVGIGTTNPEHALNVIRTGVNDTRILVGATGAGAAGIFLDASDGDGVGSDYLSLIQSDDLKGHLYVGQAGNASDLLLQEYGGNIGVGILAPTKKLDVAGDIQVSAGSDICIAGGNCLSSVSTNKQDTLPTGSTGEYIRGDHTLGIFAPEVANTVLTGFSTGANSSVTNSDSVEVAIEKLQGQMNATKASIPVVPLSTDFLPQGAINRYFTEELAIGSPLTGLSILTNSDVTSADSILSAIGKLQSQMNFADTDRTNYILKSGDSMSGSLGIGGAASASAMLDIQSTTKGFLPPRMTTVQRDAIASPVTGLVIFNTTTGQLEYFANGGWNSSNSFIGFRVSSDIVQAGTNSVVKINMNAKSFDVGNSFDLAADRFQPTVAGKYLVTLQTNADGQAAGSHNIAHIYKNGIIYQNLFVRPVGASTNSQSTVTALVDLNGTTDYVEAYYNLNSGNLASAIFHGSLQSPASSSGGGGGGTLTANSVDGSHIQDGSISTSEIADGTITSGDIAPNTISVSNLDFASSEGINLPQQAANPAVGVAGQTYYNTTTKKMMIHDGTKWVEIGGGETIGQFGVRITRSLNTVYQALEDGYVIVNSTNGNGYYSVYSDGNNPPVKEVVAGKSYASYGARGSATLPVKKGDYWKVVTTYYDNPQEIFWQPITGTHVANDGHSLDSADGSNVDSLYVGNSGDVGIGTMAPDTKLHINGVITAGNGDSTKGTSILEANYGNGSDDNPLVLGSHYSNSRWSIGYGVRPKSDTAGYISSVDNSNWQRGVLEVGEVLEFKYGAAQTTPVGNDVTLETRFKIDNNGNVGIGTDSPQGNGLHIDSSSTWTGTKYTTVGTGALETDGVRFGYDEGYGGFIWNREATGVVIATNNIERLRVASSGNVGIGTASPGMPLDVVGTVRAKVAEGSNALSLFNASNGGAWNFKLKGDGTTANNLYLDSTNLGGTAIVVKSNGNIGIGTLNPAYKLDVQGGNVNSAGAYTNVSDQRLKEDIFPLTGSLAKILKLNSVSYVWKDRSFDDSLQIGFIAQEVEKVFPEVVKTDDRGFKAMSYSQLVSPIVKAIQELYEKWSKDHEIIAKQESENRVLRNEVAKLKAQNELILERLEKLESSRSPGSSK